VTLRSDLNAEIASILGGAEIDSLRESVTYYLADSGTVYDPATGVVVQDSFTATVRVLFAGLSRHQTDGTGGGVVQPGSRVAWVLAADIPTGGPKLADWIVDGADRKMEITRIIEEPSGSIVGLVVSPIGGDRA
jgi:hypothetical protein